METSTPPPEKSKDAPKASTESVELAVPSADSNQDDATKPIDEKRLMRRINYTLIPWLTFLYILCFLDRVGIGNAKLYGMERDLGISDTQYLIAVSVFFIPYSLFEIPSNLCLKRTRPSLWLSTIILLWGIAMTCMGLARNFGGVLSLRVLLGVFEAGFLPGVIYYLSCWYRRDELGFRLAIFMTSVTVAGAFGGLLAAAISSMDGVGGKAAWSWIFIIEGLVTVVAGVAAYFFIQDFPDTARFLSPHDREYVIHRLKTDDQFLSGEEKLRWKDVRKAFSDYKTWLSAMSLIGFAGPMYAFALSLPSIIRELGYTATRANLLTVPVYFTATICSCLIGYIADRLKRRAFFNLGLHSLVGAGYIILLCSRHSALSYFATYVVAVGIFPGNPNQFAWLSNNVEGSYKRSVSIAVMITCANFTGIISSNTYRQHDAPWYTTGHAITLSYVFVGLLGSNTMYFLLRRENMRRDRGEREEVFIVIRDGGVGDKRNGVYESVEDAKKDKGDEWSGYRYIL